MNQKHLNPEEVAERLGVSVSTLHSWRYGKFAPPANRIGNYLR
jgi:predicted site-specific integrase-resolvase